MKTIRFKWATAVAVVLCTSTGLSIEPALYDNPTNAFRSISHNDYGGTNAWQRNRHARKLVEIRKTGGAPVVLIGDSITHFWETNGRHVFETNFVGSYRALDLGISADRTEHVLWRLDEGGELDGYEAKIVFLMIGTNNTGHNPIEKEPPARTIVGIKKIVDLIRKKQPNAKVVLTAIFPRGKTANDPKRLRNDIVNREIRKFCDGKNIVWLDMASRFLEPDGTLPRTLFKDSLHPTAPGYEIWFAAMKPYLEWAIDGAALPPDCGRGEEKVPRDSTLAATEPSTHMIRYGFWVDRLERNMRLIAASRGKIDLVFAGDSITHAWDTTGRAALNELLKKYSVLNLGYSGDSTANLLWRLRYGELAGYKAKCVMLMIGINNQGGPQHVAAGIKAILDEIASKQPQATVLLLPVFPSRTPDDKMRVRGEAVNAIIKDYADGEKVIWVDFTDRFLDEKGTTFGTMPDGVHPSAAAYRDIWLPAVLPYFEKIVGGEAERK